MGGSPGGIRWGNPLDDAQAGPRDRGLGGLPLGVVVELFSRSPFLAPPFLTSRKEQKSEDESDEDASESGGETPNKKTAGVEGSKINVRPRVQRGRALTRSSSCVEQPLFRHPTPPLLLKELCHCFGATWLLSGTPEAGVSLLGPLELRVPVVAMARNGKHAEAIKKVAREKVMEAMLDSQSTLRQPTLAQRWAAMGPSDSSDSEASGEEGEEQEGEAGARVKKTKKDKKDKDKKRDKKSSKKDKQKKKEGNKEKEEKREKGDKKEKGGEKRTSTGKDSKEDGGSTGVMRKLLKTS